MNNLDKDRDRYSVYESLLPKCVWYWWWLMLMVSKQALLHSRKSNSCKGCYKIMIMHPLIKVSWWWGKMMVVVDGKHLASRHWHLQTVYMRYTDLPESSPSCLVHFFISFFICIFCQFTGHPLPFIQLFHLYLLSVYRTSPSVHSTFSSVSSVSLQDIPFCSFNFFICIFCQFTGHPLLFIQLLHLYLLSVYRVSPSVQYVSS